MAVQRTIYVHNGDTYSGTFVEAGQGHDATVTVRYSGMERRQSIGTATAAIAASKLLGQLVRERLAEFTAQTCVTLH